MFLYELHVKFMASTV